MKLNFFFILIISAFFLFGCSSEDPECVADFDCFSRDCHTVSCVSERCRYEPIENCCGNGICEEGQNGFNCPQDCGACELPSEASEDFFEIYVDENHVCSNDVKSGIFSSDTITLSNQDLSGRDYKVNVKVGFNDPFNIKNDFMKVEIEMVSSGSDVENLKINRIQLISDERVPIIYADKEVDKMLWPPRSSIEEDLYFTRMISGYEDEINFNLVIHHEYDKIRRNEVRRESGTTTFRIRTGRDTLKLLKPDRDYYCFEEDCFTDNPGLEGSCVEGKPYCEYERIPNQCGNFICEPGQNKCNCPHDCGECAGVIGDYMRYTCVGENCVSELSDVQKVNNYAHELNSLGRHFTVTSYTSFNYPIVMGRDNVEITLELINEGSDFLGPVIVNKIDLIGNNNELLGTLNIEENNRLSNLYDRVTFSVPVTKSFSGYYEENQLNYDIHYEFIYERREEEQRGISSFGSRISDFTMVKVGE